jgi:hypothetical protein
MINPSSHSSGIFSSFQIVSSIRYNISTVASASTLNPSEEYGVSHRETWVLDPAVKPFVPFLPLPR